MICCYFPRARQADTGGSKQGKTILQLSPSISPVWQEYEEGGVTFGASLSFLLLSALCPPTSFPRHGSSTLQRSATLGSKFTCQAEKTTYLPHFYLSPLFSILLYALPCNLSSFKRTVTLTSPLGEARPGNGGPQPSGCSLQGHIN